MGLSRINYLYYIYITAFAKEKGQMTQTLQMGRLKGVQIAK